MPAGVHGLGAGVSAASRCAPGDRHHRGTSFTAFDWINTKEMLYHLAKGRLVPLAV